MLEDKPQIPLKREWEAKNLNNNDFEKKILFFKKQSTSTILIFIVLTIISFIPVDFGVNLKFTGTDSLWYRVSPIRFVENNFNLNNESFLIAILGAYEYCMSAAINLHMHVYVIFYSFSIFKKLNHLQTFYVSIVAFLCCTFQKIFAYHTPLASMTFRSYLEVLLLSLIALFIFYAHLLLFFIIRFLINKGLKYAKQISKFFKRHVSI